MVDAENAVWVALWEGGAVRRYSPDGTLLSHFAAPTPLVTCPGFGGPDLDILYVTSAWQGLDRATHPLAGSLFSGRPGVAGLPARRFAA